MKPDRRHQISDLYHAALSRQRQDREAFLIEACAGDEDLRQELESNKDLYGGVIENSVIVSEERPAPAVAAKLIGLLNKYSSRQVK